MRIKFIERIKARISQDGIRFTLARKLSKLLWEEDAIKNAKQRVLTKLLQLHGPVVSHGPFKGVVLSEDSWWGRFDLISKILGIYEPHVIEVLSRFADQGPKTFVDIGSADGYFPIGMITGGVFDKAYAFEISELGREKLKGAIEANSCDEKIIIGKEANTETLRQVMVAEGEAIILIDIEGAEYDFLDEAVLTIIKYCSIVCELHPWLVEDGQRKEQELEARARQRFHVSFLQRDSYSPNIFAELEKFSDDERLLACSEGRGENTRWMVLEPQDKRLVL
jgi:hypothetical protein